MGATSVHESMRFESVFLGERATHELERALRRAPSDLLTIADEPELHRSRPVGQRRGDPHCSYGFVGRTAPRPSDARDSDTDGRARACPRALRHLPNDFFAHGAMLLEGGLLNAKQIAL